MTPIPSGISLDVALAGIFGGDAKRKVCHNSTGPVKFSSFNSPKKPAKRRQVSSESLELRTVRRIWEKDRLNQKKRDSFAMELIKAIDQSLEQVEMDSGTPRNPSSSLDSVFMGEKLREKRTGVSKNKPIYQGRKLRTKRREKGR